ncbi:enoyl-CoA hydratase/isomerase family protein [Hydrogenophaga sp.]|jgi:enoyl-CoA hydratase|uniref:enoyl-CoA hydratase/isomerase family protein n=1 Tax=Hydrogenophaga sp. TaxID=1904254 RepID=UPI003F7152D8
MSDAVLYDVRGQVVVITMNRPDQRNAINEAMRSGLFDAWRRFEADPEARVAILTAAGDKAFCAGMDLKEARERSLGVPPPGYFPIPGDTVPVSKPTIAAVNGVAMAGGWWFAQACDLCVAAEGVKFAISEVKVGRGAPWAWPLAHMLPQRVMAEILMTGRAFSAERLHELGFVNQVVPGPQLMDAALALANEIAANAPLSVKACRAMVRMSTEMTSAQAARAATDLFEPVYRSADALEGPRAFAEKRAPRWTGA